MTPQNCSKPIVTIITPAYNQAMYLEATMRSVLDQDYPNLEYIVIDDGSTDESFDLAKRVQNDYPSKVEVVKQQNSGQAATLNRGWRMARGEVLGYLSSDDLLLPGAVSKAVAALEEHNEVNVTYCDFWIIDSAGARIKRSVTEEFNSKRLRVDLVCQPGPGAFFRKSVFDQTGGWDESLRQVPDFEFWLKVAKHGPFIRIPETLAEYRVHEGSASFRVMPISRADEIVLVTRKYWTEKCNDASSALANAHIIAAKNHAQSRRLAAAMYNLSRAVCIRPSSLWKLKIWRILLTGLLRRLWYGLRAKITAN